jgi:hypothetical protein
MLVNLPNGKTVDMSFDDYLRSSVEDYTYLMSQNFGLELEDPFVGSALRDRRRAVVDEPEEPENDEAEAEAEEEESDCDSGELFVE